MVRGRKTVWFRVKEGEKVRKKCTMTGYNHGPGDSSRYGMMSGNDVGKSKLLKFCAVDDGVRVRV